MSASVGKHGKKTLKIKAPKSEAKKIKAKIKHEGYDIPISVRHDLSRVLSSNDRVTTSGSLSELKVVSMNVRPPSGISEFSGPSVRILNSGRHDTMRISFKIPLCGVAANIASGTGQQIQYPGIQIRGTGSPTAAMTVQNLSTLGLTPSILAGMIATGSTATPTVIATACQPDASFVFLLSSSFSRYRCVSDLKLHYAPEASTSDTSVFGVVFTNDFYNPALGMAAYTTSTAIGGGAPNPSFSTIKNSVNSMVFSAWAPWSMVIPVDKSYEYYMSAPLEGHIGGFSATGYSFTDEMRQNFFGCLTILGSATGSGVKGQLYWEQTFDFMDFTPVASGVSVPFTVAMAYNIFPSADESKSNREDTDCGFESVPPVGGLRLSNCISTTTGRPRPSLLR